MFREILTEKVEELDEDNNHKRLRIEGFELKEIEMNTELKEKNKELQSANEEMQRLIDLIRTLENKVSQHLDDSLASRSKIIA